MGFQEEVNRRAQEAEGIKNAQGNIQTTYDKSGVDTTPLYNIDYRVGEGSSAGIDRAMQLYGQDYRTTGNQVQDIIQRRQKALNGESPAQTQMRQQRNRRLAMAKQGGATAGQQEQIRREAEGDIAATAWSQEQQALGDYQKTIGNVLSGMSALEMGWAGLGAASIPQSSGGDGSVICTELHRQGYLTNEEIVEETAYGVCLRSVDPNVYWGYRLWADPVVEMMKKSSVVTRIVSFFAVPWVRKTNFGKILNFIGLPLCRVIGKGRELWEGLNLEDQIEKYLKKTL